MQTIVEEAVKASHISSQRLFRQAFDYFENRIGKDGVFWHWQRYIHHRIVPEDVEWYCQLILQGTVKCT